MKVSEILYVTNRDEWRAWLKKNHKTKKEVWLTYYKRHTGKKRISYDEAVEEALCFGWIDSIVRRVDDERYAQKYTPRRAGSVWSKLNMRRAKKMIKQGRMTEAGLALFKEVEAKPKEHSRAEMVRKTSSVPGDLRKALAKNRTAQKNFYRFAPSYKKMYIGWILDAKKKQTQERRIRRVVEWAAQNKKPGMM